MGYLVSVKWVFLKIILTNVYSRMIKENNARFFSPKTCN